MPACPRHISEEPRFALKWPKRVAVTQNEFIISAFAGIGVYLGMDISHLFRFYYPLPVGLLISAALLWCFGTLSRGKPGSYLWDIKARWGLIGNRPGTITRYTRYWCTGDVVLSPIGIWGKSTDHMGPREPQHLYLPPSGLRGRIPRSVLPPTDQHMSLSRIFSQDGTASGASRGLHAAR